MTPVVVPDPAEVEACRCWQQMPHVRGDADPGRFFNIVCLYSMSQDELSIAESIRGLCVDTKEKRDWPAIAERQAAKIARRILTGPELADRDRTRDCELGERIAAAIGRMPLTRITERPAMGGMVHTAYPAEVIRAEAARIARAESERARQHTGTGGE